MSHNEVSKEEEAGLNGVTLQGGSALNRPISVTLSNEQFEGNYDHGILVRTDVSKKGGREARLARHWTLAFSLKQSTSIPES